MMARPLITTLGGTCCSPSALRSKLRTTTSLVNEVTMTATNGARASPTTVTRMSDGVRLPKSIRVNRQQLHSQGLPDRHQLPPPDRGSIRPDDHPRLLQAGGQLQHL